jgi:hypothetical protein
MRIPSTWQSLTILLFTTVFIPSCLAASVPFPRHVQVAIVRALESGDVVLERGTETRFLRYDSEGKVETFECPVVSAFEFSIFHSGPNGGMRIGECPNSAQLTEDMAEGQAKGFKAAMATMGGNMEIAKWTSRDTMNPQVIRNGGVTFTHVMTGGIETMLMISPGSKNVILVQGQPPNNTCLPHMGLPLCDDFRGTMREVARQLYAAQTSPAAPQVARPEPLRPGRWTICDQIAVVVREALEQSDAKQIPITETTRYKQHIQPDVRAGMQDAAREHARGMDIADAGRNVGEECLRKPYKL